MRNTKKENLTILQHGKVGRHPPRTDKLCYIRIMEYNRTSKVNEQLYLSTWKTLSDDESSKS